MTEYDVVDYNITNAAIAEMERLYMGLKVLSLDDQEGFEAVHSGRMVVKGKRIEVEKTRKELKSDALEWGRKVDSEAKRIFGLLKPIEDHLQSEEDKVTKEKERIKAEQDRIQKEKIQKRVDDLFAVKVVMQHFDLSMMSDEEYDKLLAESTAKYEADIEKEKEEQLAKEEEEKKLADERAKLERMRAEQEAIANAQAEKEIALQAEQDRIVATKIAEQERKDREKFEKEAAEKARIKAEADAKAKVEADALEEKERLEREAKERKEAEEAEEAEKIRLAELAPDKQKLLNFAEMIHDLTAGNLSVKSKKSKSLYSETIRAILAVETNFRAEIKEL